MTLKELAALIGATVVGDDSIAVSSINTLAKASAGQLSFLSNPKYEEDLKTTEASAVILADGVAFDRTPSLRAKDPYLAYQKAIVALHGFRKHPFEGVHPGAHVDPNAKIGAGTTIYEG